MAEDVGERAALRDRAAKGVVGVGGDDVALFVGVAEDVAVGVGGGGFDPVPRHAATSIGQDDMPFTRRHATAEIGNSTRNHPVYPSANRVRRRFCGGCSPHTASGSSPQPSCRPSPRA